MSELLNLTEAGRRIGLSRRRILDFIVAGRLRATPVAGGSYVVDSADLEQFAKLPRAVGRPRRQEADGAG